MSDAWIQYGKFKVPLLGIPESAVLDDCDLCHDTWPIRELHWVGPKLLCRKCREVTDARPPRSHTDSAEPPKPDRR